ncbi:MAG: hypothetical protein ACLVH9_06725 [Fusobacterium sp.]|uniref:hypothetical protein n=1 Tax=Fusobacterium sp. TaxID=68766 RepID=UPI00399B4DBC
MLIIYIVLAILSYKYLPILKNKVNYEYQKKFNITIFSKESSKRPFIAAILILVGNFYKGSAKSAKVPINFGNILIIIGICIMIYVIYDTYRKTDFLYGTIAAGIYLFILGLQLLFGIMMIALVMISIAFLAIGNSNNNNNDPYY